ncbi:MAG: phenylalanine--tRNA ligase subunit beta, partial [Alphaproteobacteria bacterium]
MKISLSWLKEFIDTKADAATIANMLVQLGHEVDAVVAEGATFNRCVVGYVQERVKHPESDRLGVCTVDVGEAAPRTIVCGAPNARAGITVAVALDGAELPPKDGTAPFKIGKSKIRGVESNGMICSVRELGLGEEHEGIWEMTTAAKVGTPLAEALGRTDVILDVAVTPNRGDCLSVYGMARDLAAAGLGQLLPLDETTIGKGAPKIKAVIDDAHTYAFHTLQVSNVKNGSSPAWLQRRLEQAGHRPRNILVDVTNYIMLTYGQPLHAYDADKVQGTLRAATAQGGETYHGIGDVKLILNAGDIVIADDSGIIGLAGILGGASTAITDTTTNVVLEAAWFDRSRIARTGQAHQLLSDARYRFERGIDPAMTKNALEAAGDILQRHASGTLSLVASVETKQPTPATIAYHPDYCRTFGGLDVPAAEQQTILGHLGFEITGKGDAWSLQAPTWRTYMENPEDVVEELLRVKGYET